MLPWLHAPAWKRSLWSPVPPALCFMNCCGLGHLDSVSPPYALRGTAFKHSTCLNNLSMEKGHRAGLCLEGPSAGRCDVPSSATPAHPCPGTRLCSPRAAAASPRRAAPCGEGTVGPTGSANSVQCPTFGMERDRLGKQQKANCKKLRGRAERFGSLLLAALTLTDINERGARGVGWLRQMEKRVLARLRAVGQLMAVMLSLKRGWRKPHRCGGAGAGPAFAVLPVAVGGTAASGGDKNFVYFTAHLRKRK